MNTLKIGPWQALEKPITALRTAVFLEEQGVPEEEVFDGGEGGDLHGVLLEEGVPLACASLREEAPGTWLVHWVATEKAHRGRGLARQVMETLLAEAARRGAERVSLEAQSTAVGFYEKLGFAPCGEEIRFPSGFVLVPMEKLL